MNIFSKKYTLPEIINLVLIGIIGIIILLLVSGTIYALARSPDSNPLFTMGKSDAAEENNSSVFLPYDDIRVFSGIGRLRIPLSNSSTMVLSIAFPYYANDISFTEELAAKINDFREIAVYYFSSLPSEKLVNMDEEAAKFEILGLYNNILRLGRIEALYFTDMMIIE
ncbi:MAG: hypothetical protein FWC03_06745 [Treponema sp.]|nr:hypothetical protein [Treponema sp.]